MAAEVGGMSDERLCTVCNGRQMVFVQGPNASHPCEHCRGTGIEPAAPSTDEGEARWWVGEWCAKHNGHHLQHGEDGSRMVVADYDSGEMVCQLLNEAVAIRAPLERDVEVARMYAAGVEGMLQQVRIENRAAEERIRELEAELNGTVETYVETTGDMGAEVLELRADVERLREALRDALDTLLDYVPKRAKPYRNGWVDGWWALATPPSSTEGTKEVEG